MYSGCEGRADVQRRCEEWNRHPRERKRKCREESGKARADKPVKGEWQKAEHRSDNHPAKITKRLLRPSQRNLVPAKDQAGDDANGHHPQESAPGLLSEDEPQTGDWAGPGSNARDEKTEDK